MDKSSAGTARKLAPHRAVDEPRQALVKVPNAHLEQLCVLAFHLGYSGTDDDWGSSASSRRRFLGRVPSAQLTRMCEFVRTSLKTSIPGRHEQRVKRVPQDIGREIVGRILEGFDDDDDEDDDDFEDLPLWQQLETLLDPAESKVLLRWLAFTESSPSGGHAVHIELPQKASDLFPTVGGLDHVKEALFRHVYLPLARPDLHERYGVVRERGILLYGPPGNGKTHVARALSSATGFAFEYVAGPQLLSKWVGEAESALRRLFTAARMRQPAIIFLDELDALGADRERQESADGCHVQQLLSLMDGLTDLGNVTVIGATNRIEAIDFALRRPGRFGVVLEVPNPELADREAVLRLHLANMPVDPAVDVAAIAKATDGLSGAQLAAVCQRAAQEALVREIASRQAQVVTQLDLIRVHRAMSCSEEGRR